MSSSPVSRTSPSGTSLRMLQDRYALQEPIGRGGMAIVYRALDTVLDRPVAVKLLYPSICSESEFVQQFLRMERHIARLFHPNLVTIYDAGASDEGCFAVMEYVPGGSLRELLARGTLLPVGEVVRIGAQLADALDLLHRERIVHGDVKPDNVLLDEESNAKLVDFGIAHLATTTASISANSLGGSVPYLAPEQLEHGRADPRSDIYALGLVIYELLAGHKAFDGENWVAVAAQRLARDPAPLGSVRPDLPVQLDRVVMHALARDPADRFATAREMREALLAAVEDVAPAPTTADWTPPEPAAPNDGSAELDDTAPLGMQAGHGVGVASSMALPLPERRPRHAAPPFGVAQRPWLLPATVAVVLIDVVLLVVILSLFGATP